MTATLLETLSGCSQGIRNALCGGGDPAWLAAIERGEFRPEQRVHFAIHTPPTPGQRIGDYQAEALRRAVAWALWHARRAERRGLPASGDALSRAAGVLAAMQGRPSAAWLALATYRAVLGVAEREWASFGFHVYVHDHLRELETSHLRTLVGVAIPTISDIQRQLLEGYVTAVEAQIAAAEALAFAPGHPPQEADGEN
jgi:hypothetical protein